MHVGNGHLRVSLQGMHKRSPDLQESHKCKCRKVPKSLDARKLSYYQPKIQTRTTSHRVIYSKGANGMANSDDTDQTASL